MSTQDPSRTRRLWAVLRPRPAGWVVLGFLLFVAVRVWIAGGTAVDARPQPWRIEIAASILLVITLQRLGAYRRLAWPSAKSGLARAHWSLLLLCLTPAALGAAWQWKVGLNWVPAAYQDGTPLTIPILAAIPIFRRLFLLGLPALLFWLTLGIHAKTNHRIAAPRFLRESATAVVDLARDLLPSMILIYSYTLMSLVLELHAIPDRDAQLAVADRLLFFGHEPVRALEALVSRPLSEWLALCYTLYVPLFPICFGVIYAKGRPLAVRELCFAITLALAVGCASYTLVPAMGPLFTERFAVSVDPYYMRDLKEQLMERNRVPRDCFPSMHTALTLIMTWFLHRDARKVFWFALPVAISMPLACVYFRYHWVVDVLAGGALAAAVVWITPRVIAAAARQRLATRTGTG